MYGADVSAAASRGDSVSGADASNEGGDAESAAHPLEAESPAATTPVIVRKTAAENPLRMFPV